jgi:hypothetical protein
MAAGVVVERLQLEADQAFGTDHTHPPQGRIACFRSTQQVGGDRPVRVEQVKAFITAHVMRRVRAAVHTLIAKREQECMHAVGIGRRDQEVDVARGADDLVRRQREPPIKAGGVSSSENTGRTCWI